MTPSANSTFPRGDKELAAEEAMGHGANINILDGNLTKGEVPNIIEQLDINYIEETSKLDMGSIASIDPTDHILMRQWLDDVYMALPKAPQIKRTRAEVPVHVRTVSVAYGVDDHFSIRVYDPVDDEAAAGNLRPALIMLHGGGWIHGYPEVDEDLSKFFASELRAVVLGVDYRLAPEYPFPIPGNDCFMALDWVSKNSKEYMIDTGRVGLWGCSAGANLAANIALRDSAENEISRIRHVNLVVPITCHPSLYPPALKSSTGSMALFRAGGAVDDAKSAVITLWEKYAGSKFADPFASVLLAEPRGNHPSAHITVSGCDRLRDEGIAYALQLRNAGVDTQLEIIPGVPHGLTLSPTSIVASQFFRTQVRVLKCALDI